MKSRTFALFLVLGLAALGSACFGMLGGGGPKATATVRVVNDVDPPSTLTIELYRNGNHAATLGTVKGGEDRTMNYSSRDLTGSYQVVAKESSGAEVRSRDFTLFSGAQVHWQLRGNSLSVVQAR